MRCTLFTKGLRVFVLAALTLPVCHSALGQNATPERLRVREVTVFKDGNSFVLQQGVMPTDTAGNVVLENLPHPVLGTFWPYSNDPNASLSAVVAGQQQVSVARTAMSIQDLIEANVGSEATIAETDDKSVFVGTIVGIPTRSTQELQETSPPDTPPSLPRKSDVVVLHGDYGITMLPLDRIKQITIKNPGSTKVSEDEFRDRLTLKLNWNGGRRVSQANVGMVYLSSGLSWTPEYKVEIDGHGQAQLKLEGTLVNNLTDLNDVTANLVIGVPTFAFAGTPDPIGYEHALAQAEYENDRSSTRDALSNSIMTQVNGFGGFGGGGAIAVGANPSNLAWNSPPAGQPGTAVAPNPEVAQADKDEDLFVFTVNHVTLKKGETMVLPIAEFGLKYRDVYTLNIPIAPPRDAYSGLNTDQQAQIIREVNQVHAVHVVRLTNNSKYPLTTAPALILSGGQLLGQGMMKYTPIGSEGDLEITTAVDIKVAKKEHEVKRTPNAQNWQGYQYARVDLDGDITLTNYRANTVDLEVTRYVMGLVDNADSAGVVEQADQFEDTSYLPGGQFPSWWSNYNWGQWWDMVNGVGRITWKLTIPAGKGAELKYNWHYFWR